MKYVFFVVSVLLLSCSSRINDIQQISSEKITEFASNDKTLEDCFQWAKKQALVYAHDGTDSVGFWYEAALPNREAFCMRDVSHQSVGAQILGLKAHNKNMFLKFAQNISESKDWCSYWEINRYNRPAPVDYANDREFWYNLNANFDVTLACLKMYEWTADDSFLKDKMFVNFFEKTYDKYVYHWQLDVPHLMTRPRFMHTPELFNPNKGFHACRGLASYVENFDGLNMSLDLICYLYAGYKTYSQMLLLNGKKQEAEMYADKAVEYQKLMENNWWNEEKHYYHTFHTTANEYYKGEGVTFALWTDAIFSAERIRYSVEELLSKEWNVENESYFPTLLYRYGYNKEAYDYLIKLRSNRRNAYPEVSYAWIEGLVGGYMGIKPEASTNSICTLFRAVGDDTAEVTNVPVWNGSVSLQHKGHQESRLRNNTGKSFIWKACFLGTWSQAEVNGKKIAVEHIADILGNKFTVVKVKIGRDKELTVTVL